MMSDEEISAIRNLIEAHVGEINTSMPGVIVSYDPQTRFAVVRPAVQRALTDGRSLDQPEIIDVPVVFPTGGGFTMTHPIKAGDGVVLHFSQRSMDAWMEKGDPILDDPRMHDLTDCYATPGLNHSGATVAAHPTDVVMSFGGATVSINPGGDITFTAKGKLTINAPGGITLNGDTNAPNNFIRSQNVTLHTHRHSGVQPGAGQTLTPVPGT